MNKIFLKPSEVKMSPKQVSKKIRRGVKNKILKKIISRAFILWIFVRYRTLSNACYATALTYRTYIYFFQTNVVLQYTFG